MDGRKIMASDTMGIIMANASSSNLGFFSSFFIVTCYDV